MHLLFGLVFCKHESGGGADEGFREDQVGDIGIGNEYHVTGMVLDDYFGVCGHVVKEQSGFDVDVFGWG